MILVFFFFEMLDEDVIDVSNNALRISAVDANDFNAPVGVECVNVRDGQKCAMVVGKSMDDGGNVYYGYKHPGVGVIGVGKDVIMFDGNGVSVNGNENVNGALTTNTLNVSGNETINGTSTIGTAKITTLNVSGNETISGTSTIGGVLTVNNKTNLNGAITITNLDTTCDGLTVLNPNTPNNGYTGICVGVDKNKYVKFVCHNHTDGSGVCARIYAGNTVCAYFSSSKVNLYQTLYVPVDNSATNVSELLSNLKVLL